MRRGPQEFSLNAKVDSVPGPASKHSSHGGFPDMHPSPHGPGLVKTGIVDLRITQRSGFLSPPKSDLVNLLSANIVQLIVVSDSLCPEILRPM